MTTTDTDLAQHVAWLEQLLKPGYSLHRTRRGWFLKRWDSFIDAAGTPRMDWFGVDSDSRLEELLARLGETG